MTFLALLKRLINIHGDIEGVMLDMSEKLDICLESYARFVQRTKYVLKVLLDLSGKIHMSEKNVAKYIQGSRYVWKKNS